MPNLNPNLNLNPPIIPVSERRLGLRLRLGLGEKSSSGVALVITLLMLSVITFLAIAFLAMSERNKSAVNATIDIASARAAAEAAQARAISEITAQMLAHADALDPNGNAYYYDYMVSQAFHSPSNFYAYPAGSVYDPNNVNYDSFWTNPTGYSPAAYVQNIANLWYDPQPPVFVVTNQSLPNNYDFRFWVDINRNGKYETNGIISNIADNLSVSQFAPYSLWANGEPEWIGILKNPLFPHSSSNQFIERYAYLVLPVGKTLDMNYMGNFLKALTANAQYPFPTNLYDLPDYYARDQGVASYELNPAGVLDAISPWAYETTNIASYPNPLGGNLSYNPYYYNPPNWLNSLPNTGNAFDDAQAILGYRYGSPSYSLPYLYNSFTSNTLTFQLNYIDMFCQEAPLNGAFDYNGTNYPSLKPQNRWPGSYQSNQFYDVQDWFDPTKTSKYFTNRMIQAALRTNTFDRYTFNRLLSTVGMGSSPEYGVYVHADNGTPILRTKVNLNFDNTAQITNANAPFAPMPTNLANWTPIGFFTNAADLLVRSQTFGYTNILPNTTNINPLLPYFFTNYGYNEIPIYRTNNPGVRYNGSVHRMLQLAANIYDATSSSNYISKITSLPPVRHPSVFRPYFGLANTNTTNVGINIIGYVQMTNQVGAPGVGGQLSQPFYDLPTALVLLQQSSANSNINIAGIPWVVGVNKGLPQFYQYSYQSDVIFERKLLFVRGSLNGAPDTNHPPKYTNQFICMCVSNSFGADAWNPYPSNFTGMDNTYCFISNYVTLGFTNNHNFGTNLAITNVYPPTLSTGPAYSPFTWGAWAKGLTDTNGIITFFKTNITSLPACYFSPTKNTFVYFPNNIISSNSFLPVDTNQTGFPTYDWTLNITNHLVYALYDGPPGGSTTALLDFVNLGPFGSSIDIPGTLTSTFSPTSPGSVLGLTGGSSASGSANPWLTNPATVLPNSLPSTGLLNQIQADRNDSQNFVNDIQGTPSPNLYDPGTAFGGPYEAASLISQTCYYVANDPMVHYTVDDLIMPNQPGPGAVSFTATGAPPLVPLTNDLGTVNRQRYGPWGAADTIGNNMLFKDPQLYSATNWNFPTNKFPSIGWLGRVHRGTPWQSVYLKADGSAATSNAVWANTWVSSPYITPYEACPENYPTNDWALMDLFTTAPNDSSATGLLSVNQTNDAAWAALFAGVISPVSATNGAPIGPINDVSNLVDFYSPYGGINAFRATNILSTGAARFPNGIFHGIGQILGAPSLTTQNPFLLNNGVEPSACSDEVVERIPQEILSLLKVGEPQFAIFAWGQSLRPKGPPYISPGSPNNGIYTNYEITGETLTRTVCHIVHTNGLKMVVDSYNVENSSN